MKVAAWLSPGDPRQRTGGYLYNARMVTELRGRGWDVDVVEVQGAWPLPGLTDSSALDRIPSGVPVVADGLLWPGLGPAGAALAARCPVTVVVHSLLARETGLTAVAAERLDLAERAALGLAAGLIATSENTRSELATEADVILPGTDPAPRCLGGDGTQLLTVGTLTRRKGHDRLFASLEGLTVPWRLTCAGAARDPVWAAHLAQTVAERGLADRVSFVGDLGADALEAAYATADIVVQAAEYEAFGMAIAEAVARGLPVVTSPAGVNRHLPAGAVVEVSELGAAISGLLADPVARARQAQRAWDAASALPTWPAQADRLAAILERTR